VGTLIGLGVKPGDVRYVAISHAHPDHAGNVDEFPDATLIIQKSEWDCAMTACAQTAPMPHTDVGMYVGTPRRAPNLID